MATLCGFGFRQILMQVKKVFSSGCGEGEGGPRQKMAKCDMGGGGRKYQFLSNALFE